MAGRTLPNRILMQRYPWLVAPRQSLGWGRVEARRLHGSGAVLTHDKSEEWNKSKALESRSIPDACGSWPFVPSDSANTIADTRMHHAMLEVEPYLIGTSTRKELTTIFLSSNAAEGKKGSQFLEACCSAKSKMGFRAPAADNDTGDVLRTKSSDELNRCDTEIRIPLLSVLHSVFYQRLLWFVRNPSFEKCKCNGERNGAAALFPPTD